jgi:hypothetical protein
MSLVEFEPSRRVRLDAPAPVVVFAYARRHHLQRTIDSLRANPEAPSTELHVYCDGPRTPQDRDKIEAVRDYVRSIDGFASVRHVFQDDNLGLARSIVGGVTELLGQHDRIIVVEDDLLLSPHFLGYMNDALECYRHDEQVASVHGYCYPIDVPLGDTFFLRGADCWGWATWARAWRHFNVDGRFLLQQLRERRLTRVFDLDGSHAFTAMLEDQVAGRNDSWAIRWHASCFLAEMLTLYPGRTLVENIGNDASGTHCSNTDAFSRAPTTDFVPVRRIPLAESGVARRAISIFLRSKRPSLMARARDFFSGLWRGAVA